MFLNLTAPPVPPPVNAGMIQTTGRVFFVAGLLLALAILPPVRHAVKAALTRCTEFFYGPPQVEAPTQLVVPVEPISKPARREITEFDYTLFE